MAPSPSPDPFDLDRGHDEIRQRWFVWTAAGLTVHPATRTDRGAGPATLRLQVTRPNADAEIVVAADGQVDLRVLRPDAETTVHTTTRVTSVEAFGELLDRVVELITWSGVPTHSEGPDGASLQESAGWVAGYDGVPYRPPQ